MMLPDIEQQTLKDLIGQATEADHDTEGFIRLTVCEDHFEPIAFPQIDFEVVESGVNLLVDDVEAVLEQVRLSRTLYTLTVAVIVNKEDTEGREMYTIIGFASVGEQNFKRMLAEQLKSIVASIDENEWYNGYEGYGTAGIVDGDSDDVVIIFK